MKKKLGRTFAEAAAEYEAEHGNLEGYHRDIDEVLADPSIADAFDSYMKDNPEEERKFWESALEFNEKEYPNSEWTRRLREACRTGKFPPEPVY